MEFNHSVRNRVPGLKSSMASNYFFGIDIEKLKMRIQKMEKGEGNTDSEVEWDDSGSDSEKGKKEDFFFEGAEKLLEIWFTTKNRYGTESDLRSIPRFLGNKYTFCLYLSYLC